MCPWTTAGGRIWGWSISTAWAHRNILYFGRRDSTTHQLRAEGYLQACRKFGLEPRFCNSDFPRSSIENGYHLARELFSKPVDYTAIFASTDSNALAS